jgi:FAS-associated factor 2
MAEDSQDKIAYFQAITGLGDPDLCAEILSAHNWDLEQAVSSFVSPPPPPASTSGDLNSSQPPSASAPPHAAVVQAGGPPPPPGIAWRLITLPFYVVSGGVGLFVGTVRFGAWIAGGVLSRSLSLLGLAGPPSAEGSDRLVTLSASGAEAAEFVNKFTRDFGSSGMLPFLFDTKNYPHFGHSRSQL